MILKDNAKKNTSSAWCGVLYWVRMSIEEAIQHDGCHPQWMKQHDLLTKQLKFGKSRIT